MLAAETMLATIKRAYAARCEREPRKLDDALAPDATFRLNGAQHVLDDMSLDETDAQGSIDALMRRFTFHAAEVIDSVVSDRRVAARVAARISADGGPPADTEFVDIWTFDDAGKVTAIAQFADTALIARQVRGAA